MLQIKEAVEDNREDIQLLLASQQLPSEDLPASLTDFLIATEGTALIGLIGLEKYNTTGLLRSMVVHPGYRNRQIAGMLVHLLEQKASAYSLSSLYLLTETAAKYFEKKGYQVIHRSTVPDVLLQSTEFSHVCPASATVMMKTLVQEHTPADVYLSL